MLEDQLQRRFGEQQPFSFPFVLVDADLQDPCLHCFRGDEIVFGLAKLTRELSSSTGSFVGS